MDGFYMKNYNCVMPFQTFKPQEKQCQPNKQMTNEYWDLLQNTIFEFDCPLPCAAMAVTYPPISKGKGTSNEAFVQFILNNTIKVQTSYWNYTIVTLLAEVGGYVGLLLGISLLDTTRVIDKVYNFYHLKYVNRGSNGRSVR